MQETRWTSTRGQSSKILRGGTGTSRQVQIPTSQLGARLREFGRPESSVRLAQHHGNQHRFAAMPLLGPRFLLHRAPAIAWRYFRRHSEPFWGPLHLSRACCALLGCLRLLPVLLWNICCRPPDCEDVEDSEGPSSLSSACEGNGGIQMFSSLSRGSCGTHGCQFDMRERSDSCFAAPLFFTAGRLASASAPSCACCLSSLHVRGMCALARGPRNQGCRPVLPTICRARCCSTHESFQWLCQLIGYVYLRNRNLAYFPWCSSSKVTSRVRSFVKVVHWIT